MRNALEGIWNTLQSVLNNFTNRIEAIQPDTRTALIGVFAALFVAYLQDWQERRRNDDEQNGREQKQMEYLYYLMKNTNKFVAHYDKQAKEIAESYKNDPFAIPSFLGFSPNNIHVIATKLNQEEYIMASIRQLKAEEPAELFDLYNTIDDNYQKASSHYLSQFSELVKDKDKYEKDLGSLIEAVNQVIINYNEAGSSANDRIIYQELNALLETTNTALKNTNSRTLWLRDSKVVFVDKVIQILNPRGSVSHRTLMRQAYEVRDQFNYYYGRMVNVVNALESSRAFILRLWQRLEDVSLPLYGYINKIKQDESDDYLTRLWKRFKKKF